MRSLFNIAAVAVVTIFYCFGAYVRRLFDSTGNSVIELCRGWGRCVSAVTGMTVQLRGHTGLDPSRPYVFMANHVSAADIWVLLAVLPVPVRMIAKKQLGRIPFFGWAMWAGRFIFIDRENAAAARRSIVEAERRIRGGDSVLLFPEGTRSRDGKLSVFKKGGFHLAMGAGVEIVPIAIRGTYAALPPDSFRVRPCTVTIELGSPIPTEGLVANQREELLNQVHAKVAEMLARAPVELEEHANHRQSV